MSNSNIMRGTMMLTGANFLSKVLGILYVIPFYALVGETGGALFQYAYTPYMIFISIATLGIPLAMSKFVSKYHALGDYQTKEAMFKSGMLLMLVMGVVCFLIMFFTAGLLANFVVPSEQLSNSVEDVKFVIQMVSFALIVIPPMSLVRGYFQGHESMGPTAVSVVVEQVVRIVFLLAAAYMVLHVFQGTVSLAVGLATFAAFVGALASAVILAGYYKRRKPYIDEELATVAGEDPKLSKKQMYIEMLTYAGPFILVGIATPLYQFVDTLTFNRAMTSIGQGEMSEELLSVIVLYGHKLAIIPVTIATGLALAVLPAITRAFTEDNPKQYNSYINQALLIIFLLILPAVVGLSLLSDQAYGTFYSIDSISYAGPLLGYYAPIALFFALFTVTAAILQGLNKQNFAVISLAIGLFVKITFNMPLITQFGATGAVLATGLAVGSASILNLIVIYRVTRFDLKALTKKLLLIIILAIVMGAIVVLVRSSVGLLFDELSKMMVFTQLVTSVVIGGYVYLWLAYKTTLLERLLGERVKKISKIFI
ncbi:putative polysaccharide biosynthesis protein [Halalkalibacillus halophilus]|uniref:putative polysaccharide biosynthesis protein n=1 Tax=Halalkalibacillus halophilus TaxID=392827 RepID=UPI000407B35E|nr:polysaccharide biosynthesis protein [Halalkalibacillus halophilus]